MEDNIESRSGIQKRLCTSTPREADQQRVDLLEDSFHEASGRLERSSRRL